MPVVNQAQVNQELFERVGKCERGYAEMNGYLAALIAQNDKLIRLLSRVCYGLITISVFLLLIVAYGAVGERGLHSVRQAMPSLPAQTAAIPTHNDFDKWMNGRRALT